jgi:hypothetical protein
MDASTEFLTPEECAEVDKALLTSHGKFTTRVAIYALRSLKAIAAYEKMAIADLQPHQIEDWVYQDPSLQQGLEMDQDGESARKFRQFFANLVISSTRPLTRAAQDLDVTVEQLTVPQVISWFEADAKKRLNQC